MLSVIISCYNCKPYIKEVLNSILIQGEDDLEVIISDDNSTDGFMEIVDQYRSLLNIKYFKVGPHKIHCPGNTRRDGLSHATGDWVTFMDHDDQFQPGSFQMVKREFEKVGEPDINFVYTPVNKIDLNGNAEAVEAVTWLHGNFYRRQWLIDNDINFREDLYGNEDLYFNNLVYGTMAGTGEHYIKIATPIYNWYARPESTSNKKEEGVLQYTEKYFGDYLIANSEPHFIGAQKYPSQRQHFEDELTQMLLFAYLYYQRAIYTYKNEEILKDMLNAIKETFEKTKEILNVDTQYIITNLTSNLDRYWGSVDIIGKLSGKFVPDKSIKDFYNSL